MRIKRFNLLPCLAIFSMAALVSCSKDETDELDFVPDSFSINGQKYNTLQEAVQAAAASGDEGTVIKLTSNTSGDGFTVNEGFITIDFGPYTYYLNSGKAITANSSIIAMTGTGGTLKGNGTVIKCQESALDIEGNLNIKGDMDLTTMNYCGLWEDYSGTFSGDVKLNDTYLYIESDKAVLNIGNLNTVSSALNVAAAKSVNIDNVANKESIFPVRADAANLVTVKNGAEVHVHKYAAGAPASCSVPEMMAKACTECDHFIPYMDENNTKVAECDAEMLEHFAAVEATDTEWGNIEYWECFMCGKCYADEHAKKELAPQDYMIKPKNSIDLSDFVYEEEELIATRGLDMETVQKVGEGIGKAVEIIEGIIDFVNDVPSEEERLKEMFKEMDRKLDEINKKLDAMDEKLNATNSSILQFTADAQLSGRLESLKYLDNGRADFEMMCESIENNGGFDEDEMYNILTHWRSEDSRFVMATKLASNYGSNQGVTRGVDDLWMDVIRPSKMWEHEGYGLREANMNKDAAVIQMSAIMAACYIVFAKDDNISEEYVVRDLGTLRDNLEAYAKAQEEARKTMDERNANYRIYYKHGNAKDVKFARNVVEFDVVDKLRSLWEQNHDYMKLKWDQHSNCTGASMAESIGIEQKFDEDLIKNVLAEMQMQNPIAALKKVGFKGINKHMFVSLHKRQHSDDNDCEAWCNNWNWTSYRSGRDVFYMEGVLKDQNSTWCGEQLLKGINIARASGVVDPFGDRDAPNAGRYQAVVVVK